MSLMSQAPAVFTSSDCISASHSVASECCPQLVSLYRSMGIDDSNITFLLYELHQHVQAVFTTTYREAEEERQRLLTEIDQQTAQIPLLAREVDDASALNELAAIGGGGGGLRAKAEGVKAIWTRLTEVKQLSGKVIQDGLRELGLLYREVGVQQRPCWWSGTPATSRPRRSTASRSRSSTCTTSGSDSSTAVTARHRHSAFMADAPCLC